MLPAELLASPLPPVLAFTVVVLGLGLRWLRQRDESKKSEWDRMRDLLEELRTQRDRQDRAIAQRDELIEQQAAHIADLSKALRRHEHEENP